LIALSCSQHLQHVVMTSPFHVGWIKISTNLHIGKYGFTCIWIGRRMILLDKPVGVKGGNTSHKHATVIRSKALVWHGSMDPCTPFQSKRGPS
jgi:hypothetical protein